MNEDDWNLSPKEAVARQRVLRQRVRQQPLVNTPKLIGGTDISFNLYSNHFYAAVVVLDYATLEVVETASAELDVDFPYVPGLLSFREIPALVEAWKKVKRRPDVIMVDGHGIAHPRRMGIATHFGLVTGVPTLGCAKKVLTGKHEEPGPEKGDAVPLMDGEDQIGYALRGKVRVKPVFISPGHLLDLEGALAVARHCCLKHKLPEPTRRAHLAVNALRRGA